MADGELITNQHVMRKPENLMYSQAGALEKDRWRKSWHALLFITPVLHVKTLFAEELRAQSVALWQLKACTARLSLQEEFVAQQWELLASSCSTFRLHPSFQTEATLSPDSSPNPTPTRPLTSEGIQWPGPFCLVEDSCHGQLSFHGQCLSSHLG